MAVDAKCPSLKPKKIGDVEYSQQQMEEFREAFHEFDIDGDGTISCQVGTYPPGLVLGVKKATL